MYRFDTFYQLFGRATQLLAGALILLAGPAAHAGPTVTAVEMKALPPYCADSEASTTYNSLGPRYKYWSGIMGEVNFARIHHYCWGMTEMMRVQMLPKSSQTKRNALLRVLAEYEFCFRGCTPNFILLPEIYFKYGQAAALLENWSLALESFSKSWERKQDYWPSYLAAAEIYLAGNMKSDALSTLKEGLRHAPNTPQLRALYEKLGGNLPEIDILAAESAAAAAAAASAASAASAAEAASAASPQ